MLLFMRCPAHFERLRHPRAPGLSLTGFRLVSRTTPWGFPYFVTCLAIEQYGVEKTEDRFLLAISRTVPQRMEISIRLKRPEVRQTGTAASPCV
jgi:hypothetical protein